MNPRLYPLAIDELPLLSLSLSFSLFLFFSRTRSGNVIEIS